MRIITWLCTITGALALANGVAYAGRWWAERGEHCGEEARGFVPTAVAFLAECIALGIALFGWPLDWLLRDSPSRDRSDRTVLLVPGFAMSRVALGVLRRRLRRGGWSVAMCRCRTWRLDLDAAAADLEACVRAMAPPASPLAVVGFGFGGLVLRHWANRAAPPGVRCLITVGTPHQGTQSSLFGFGRLRRLRPDSPLIQQLAAADRVPDRFDVIAIASDFDAVVTPSARAYYARAFNIEVRGVGHFHLLRARRVGELIQENLAAAAASAEQNRPASTSS